MTRKTKAIIEIGIDSLSDEANTRSFKENPIVSGLKPGLTVTWMTP